MGIGFTVPVVSHSRATRIAVVLDRSAVSAWMQEFLANLAAAPWADWYLIEADDRSHTQSGREGSAYRLLEAIDRRAKAHPSLDDATRLVDARGVLPLSAVPRPDAFDVMVDLRPGSLRALPDLNAVCQRVWSVEFATPEGYPSWPTLFWAWFEQQPVTEVKVVETDPTSGRRTVVASSCVSMHSQSLTVSRSRAFWRAGDLLLRGLARIDATTGACPTTSVLLPTPPAEEQPVPLPGPGVVLRVAARRFRHAARHATESSRLRHQWMLGLRRGKTGGRLDERTGFEAIIPPPDREYADPFIVSEGTRQYLFIEDFSHANDKGHISVIEFGHDGSLSEPRPVLVRPYHLSYPFVFHDGTNWYLIPETASREAIELYRAVDFPNEWEFVTELVTGIRALDTTVHVDSSGRYWLFTSLERPGRNRNDELFLFSSTEIAGPWSPHPENPIVSDVRFARPAGKLFAKGGSLIRPAQDCSTRYGAAIVFRRIVRLDATHYEEAPVATLLPEWYPGLEATHTYNVDRDVEVVDGQRVSSRRGTYRASVRRRFARAGGAVHGTESTAATEAVSAAGDP